MPFEFTTAPDGVIITGSAGSATSFVGPVDTTRFMNCVVQITGTFVATVTFEGSSDEISPTNWTPILSSTINTGNLVTASTTVGSFYVPLLCRWFRVRTSAWTSGTVNASVLFSEDQLPSIQNSNITGSVSLATKAGGGATAAKVAATASTNATLVKATAGVITSIVLSNTTAALKYLKLYSKATAPVVGTDVPILTLAIPANGNLVWDSPIGLTVATGIGYGITGAVAETDTTATAANDVVGVICYS